MSLGKCLLCTVGSSAGAAGATSMMGAVIDLDSKTIIILAFIVLIIVLCLCGVRVYKITLIYRREMTKHADKIEMKRKKLEYKQSISRSEANNHRIQRKQLYYKHVQRMKELELKEKALESRGYSEHLTISAPPDGEQDTLYPH